MTQRLVEARFALGAIACLSSGSGCMQPTGAVPLAAAALIATPAPTPNLTPHVVGTQSCASAGCHGQPFDGTTRDSRFSYTIWSLEDPHSQAFDILYSPRSVAICRKLGLDEHASPDWESRLTANRNDNPYDGFLENRCVGCHATGLPGMERVAGESDRRTRPGHFSGVGCESCHGAASHWLHTHDKKQFTQADPGFVDTSNLIMRARVCVGCHIGPMTTERARYDVDHDLIAAGHPRLLFELDSYLESYPKHWNLASNQQRGEQLPRASPSENILHTDVWRLGQIQSARQLFFQVRNRHSSGWWPEFANYDCQACHHAMGNPGRSGQTYAAASGRGSFVASSLFARDYLPAAIRAEPALELPEPRVLLSARDDLNSQLAAYGQPLKLSASLRELFDMKQSPPRVSPPENLLSHAKILSDLLDPEKNPNDQLTWETTVEFFLALQALKRDCSDQLPLSAGRAALFAATGKLEAKLTDISLTDSMTAVAFDPRDFKKELLDAQNALRNLTISDFDKSP